MQVRDLVEECALHVHDEDFIELRREHWLRFVASASRDIRNAGHLLPAEDDESITIVNNQWEYPIPAGFAYIYDLYIPQSVNGINVYDPIPRTWTVRLNDGKPMIIFSDRSFMTPNRPLKVVGQRRPTIYSDENETIDPGMESYLRERVLYFAFRYLGVGLSDLSRWRQQMAIQAHQSSEQMMGYHPQEFRVLPSSIAVPGRA